MVTYRGYITDSPTEAAEAYKRQTGLDPTLIVARPQHVLLKEHELLVRSRFGAAGALLVTHEASSMPDELPPLSVPSRVISSAPEESGLRPRGRGRPRTSERARCPMCSEPIRTFANLGWWWGWQRGVEPPYWQQVRDEVFERDEYTCYSCHKKKPAKLLALHHKEPKESGGADSTRNLVTVCKECHEDTKPIYPNAA